ncbi:hypothetical protein GCM10020001_028030 [Nonomuraea salmonea]
MAATRTRNPASDDPVPTRLGIGPARDGRSHRRGRPRGRPRVRLGRDGRFHGRGRPRVRLGGNGRSYGRGRLHAGPGRGLRCRGDGGEWRDEPSLPVWGCGCGGGAWGR